MPRSTFSRPLLALSLQNVNLDEDEKVLAAV
jgi:hypothetical protein